MNEERLRRILLNTPIPYNGGHKEGGECRILMIPGQKFVVKTHNPNGIANFRFTLEGCDNSMAHLGGAVPKTSTVSYLTMIAESPDETRTPFVEPVAIVQEKGIMIPEYLKQETLDDKAIGILGEKVADIDKTILKSGCYRVEADLGDFGIFTPEKEVYIVDMGTIRRGNKKGGSHFERYEGNFFLHRGLHLYLRLRYMVETNHNFAEAYKEASELEFNDIDLDVTLNDLTNPIGVAKEIYSKMGIDPRNSRAIEQVYSQIIKDTMIGDLIRKTILVGREGLEFIRLAKQEKTLHFQEDAVGKAAEPFLTY